MNRKQIHIVPATETGGAARPRRGSEGYVLPLVLAVALVGVLLGLGRLAAFQYQCKIRFDRQREIERILATRSALRWLELQHPPPLTSVILTNITESDREIRIQVDPVPPIYPAPGSGHLDIRTGNIDAPHVRTSADPDMTVEIIGGVNQPYDLRIGSQGTTGHTGFVAIDMPNIKANWRDDVYGRRYWIQPQNVNPNEGSTGDVFRLWITPLNGDPHASNMPAIGIEQRPTVGGNSETRMLYRLAGDESTNQIGGVYSHARTDAKGFQLAADKITFLRWIEIANFGKYELGGSYLLPAALMEAFHGQEITLTLEVASMREVAGDNSFRWIRVDPAYEYTLTLIWPRPGASDASEVATVVHLRPFDEEMSEVGKAYTYDSHGTKREP